MTQKFSYAKPKCNLKSELALKEEMDTSRIPHRATKAKATKSRRSGRRHAVISPMAEGCVATVRAVGPGLL